jgi:hypothetical protein
LIGAGGGVEKKEPADKTELIEKPSSQKSEKP